MVISRTNLKLNIQKLGVLGVSADVGNLNTRSKAHVNTKIKKKFMPNLTADDSKCETNRGTCLKEGFGSSINLRNEDEIQI